MSSDAKGLKDFNFDIRDGRAMVSLGPKSSTRFCTYACAFCYVHADFASYPTMSPKEIRDGLALKVGEFDIVYVSGDTDSLAPGRTDEGLDLIEALATLGTDVLFTTRAPLTDKHLDRLAVIDRQLKERGNLLFGCISISRLRSAPHVEPPPVPSPETRLNVLKGLKDRGIISVLAMRPFLPVVPVEEYLELARIATPFVDIILGEVWYADKGGILEEKVFGNVTTKILDHQTHKMDFDSNDKFWKVWEGNEIHDTVKSYCLDAGMPFFMRSRPAILHVRNAHANIEMG